VRKKKFPQKKPTWAEERKKGQLGFTTLVSPGTGRDEKGAPHPCTIHLIFLESIIPEFWSFVWFVFSGFY
jgi:hypothetical protein